MTDYNLRGVFADSENPSEELVDACRDWAEASLGDRDGGDKVAAAIVAAQRQQNYGEKVVAWFKESAIGEDDDRRITGTLVEERSDELVVKRTMQVPNPGAFFSGDYGGLVKKKTVRTTIRKDALRNWSVKA